MGDRSPKMSKTLFGYDRESVERMLVERDAMLSMAERRVQAAEAKAAEMETRLRSLEDEEALREAGLLPPADGVAAAAATAYPAEPAFNSESIPEELTKVVNAAEASASQIIQAWMSTRDQIMQADRLWREVQEEVVRFAAWRDDVEPIMELVQAYVQEARAKIDEVPARVQAALSPAVDAMVNVGEGMSRFAAVSTMPLLPPPLRASAESSADAARAAEPIPPIIQNEGPESPAEAPIEPPSQEVAAPEAEESDPEAMTAMTAETAETEPRARRESEPQSDTEEERPPLPPLPIAHGWLEDDAVLEGQLEDLTQAAVSRGAPEKGSSTPLHDIFDN